MNTQAGGFVPALKDIDMHDNQIKHLVDRFLAWKLPANFSPDAGISFKAEFNENTDHPMKHEPSGTNLFTATQAEAMVRHMLEGLPSDAAPVAAGGLPQFGYTGPNPEKGFVGYVNIQRTDDGVRFTVRAEGENPAQAAYVVPTEQAVALLAAAAAAFVDQAA